MTTTGCHSDVFYGSLVAADLMMMIPPDVAHLNLSNKKSRQSRRMDAIRGDR